ncbi:MAG: DNA double-strand break repair nuclease NurA [Candidatus Bathyarchaeia archaeon]
MASLLSSEVKRFGSLLRLGAEEQVEEARGRLEATVGLYRDFVASLIVSDFDPIRARKTAEELWGSSKVTFAAIDGSQDQRLISGLAVFWGGAYAVMGTVDFTDQGPVVEYATGFTQRSRGVSSCVPIYVDQVQDVDQSVMHLGLAGELTVTSPLTEQAVVDNSTIASWIMTFSELYLAYRMVLEEDAKILLLDRSLSATLNSLTYDTSRRSRWELELAILGLEIDGICLDKNDLAYARHYIVNEILGLPPPRGDYLRYALVLYIQRSGKAMSLQEICEGLGILGKDRVRRAEAYLEKSVKEGYLRKTGSLYEASQRYLGTWNRIRKLVDEIGAQLFEGKGRNPMKIKKGEKYEWLTTRDVAFLSLFCFQALIEESWRRKVLLIGITKDTTATDFKAHLAPVCGNEGIWPVDAEGLRAIPSTDRMLLQAMSVFAYDQIPVPWSLIEYDTAFQTIVPDFKGRKGYISGGRRNRISRERLFLKSYVQLDQSAKDPRFRSNVLLIDRLVRPEYDADKVVRFKQEYGGAEEPIEVLLYPDRDATNEVQNLVMVLLSSMGARSIPEVFGHNKPLFIADKIAKAQRQKFSGIIEGTALWLMNSPRLRRFCFYMNTFRERREEVEHARRR